MLIKDIRENYGTGYVSVWRSILAHWIGEDKPYNYLSAWIYILLKANHKSNFFPFGKDIMEVTRGSFITSTVKLADAFGWSRTKVSRFLGLLENDSMIELKKDTKKTYITICNYNTYQNIETAKEQIKNIKKTSKKHQKNTNNNDNNDNNENKYIPAFDEFSKYAKTLSIYHSSFDFQLKAKYEAWVENKWRDGNNKPIKNWKTKLSNTMPYFKKDFTEKEHTGSMVTKKQDDDFRKVIEENKKQLAEQGRWKPEKNEMSINKGD